MTGTLSTEVKHMWWRLSRVEKNEDVIHDIGKHSYHIHVKILFRVNDAFGRTFGEKWKFKKWQEWNVYYTCEMKFYQKSKQRGK